jgi:putative zinc finger/helix-turn-helix YgiT family protein
MKTSNDCPFCGKSSKLESQKTEKEFRKEKLQIREFYYRCGSCGEEFTTTSTDEVTVQQVYNQYREKYGLLFPEEMVALREKYGLSAQKISQVLGLGINTYSNYENDEIPTLANSNLIRSAKQPGLFLTLLLQSKELFSEKSFKEIVKRVQDFCQEDDLDPLIQNLNWYSNPNKFTGYTVPNPTKLSNLLLYLITFCKPEYNDRLKLNKLLFYADFSHYKNTGKSITGLSYRAIPYGPAPTKYDFILALLIEDQKLIEPSYIKTRNSVLTESFKAIQQPDISVFDKEEIATIHQIVENFRDTSSWDLVEMSHKERAWIELNGSSGIVSYQEYGFDING